MEILVATRNAGKVREIKRLLEAILPGRDWNISDLTATDLPGINENGLDFMDNARIKAMYAASLTGKICLGEDSGLEVDILNGSPGIKSHRFSASGEDDDNNLLLLSLLEGLAPEDRRCRYKCAMVISRPGMVLAEGLGATEGIIADKPDGFNGFGYDPIFYSLDLGKTFGQATDNEKDAVSHRRRALLAIGRILGNMAG